MNDIDIFLQDLSDAIADCTLDGLLCSKVKLMERDEEKEQLAYDIIHEETMVRLAMQVYDILDKEKVKKYVDDFKLRS